VPNNKDAMASTRGECEPSRSPKDRVWLSLRCTIRPVRVQNRRDQALAAEHAFGAEARFQSVQVAHAVEQRQDRRLRSNRRRKRGHCVVKIVGLAAEKDEIEGLV
jgi:hypothetical protein